LIKFQLFVLLLLLSSTESRTQASLDSVLTHFKAALKACPLDKAPDSHKDTLNVFLERHSELLSECKNKFTFYKRYAIYLSSKKQDTEAVPIQRDTILPLQKSCLESDDIAIYITHFNVAEACRWSGQIKEAEKYYLKLVRLMQDSKTVNKRFSRYYKYIGNFYRYTIRDLSKAALYYERSLKTYTGKKTSKDYVLLLKGKALNMLDAKKYKDSKNICLEAIQIMSDNSHKNNKRLLSFYQTLARSQRHLNEFKEAKQSILNAISIATSMGEGALQELLFLKSTYSHILKSAGNYDQALKVLNDIEKIQLKLGDKLLLKRVSENFENEADVYVEKGDYTSAIDHYQEGVSIWVDFEPGNHLTNPRIIDNAIIDYPITQRQLGLKTKPLYKLAQSKNSEAYYKATIETVLKYDTLSQLILQSNWEEDTHQLRINQANAIYETGVKSALALYDIVKEEEYIEAAHDISSRFKAQLLSRGIDFKESKKKILGDSLLAIEKNILEAITKAESAYSKIIISDEKSLVKEAFDKVMDLKAAHDDFLLSHNIGREIDHTALRHIPSAKELQAELMEDQAIVEYFIAEDVIYTFLISKEDIFADQSTISDADIDNYLNWVSSNAQEINLQEFSKKLLKPLLKTDTSIIKRLIIIPDQKLLQVPFEALSLVDGEYLIEQFDISYDYSTVFLNDNTAYRNKHSFMGLASSYAADNFDLASMNLASLAPLPYATKEIEKLEHILGGKTFINKEATKNNFLQAYDEHSILHLALHSELNERFPDQSALIFESDVSDHFLTASEIYNLDINSELTVLSACNTAVGELNLGDGIRSLTRSFLHAGCQSVLTSLWETPDVSTSLIMEDFYKELKAGSAKDVALRKAKLNYINNIQPTFQHPRYWAHLILVGNPSAINFNSSSSGIKLALLGLAVLLLTFLAFRFFTRNKRYK